MNFGADGRGVDVDDAGVDVTHRAEGIVDVAGVDRRRQAILDAVGDVDRLVQRFDGNDRRDRAEDLLLRDTHIRPHIAEDRRLVEVTVRVAALFEPVAAEQDRGALLLADLDVLQHGLVLLLVDRRPHRHLLVQPAADGHRARALGQPPPKLLGHGAVGDQPARSRAALACRAERAPDRSLDHQIKVGVVHHDDRVLAAHLERHSLERLGGYFRDVVADFGRAGKGEDPDLGVTH